MYIAVYIFLLLVAVGTRNQSAINKRLYKVSIIVLWILLSFRYGQGSDYFGYEYLHGIAMHGYKTYAISVGKNEVGFVLLCKLLGDNFSFFVWCVSTFQMLMLNRFIKKYSYNNMLSLILFYPTFYLTYYFSAIRQGIIMALFIGVLIDMIEKRAWKQYVLICILSSTVHLIALILLVIPLALKLSMKQLGWLVSICAAIGVFMLTGVGKNILLLIPIIGSRLSYYITGNSLNILALLVRLSTYICVILLYNRCKNEVDNKVIDWIKIYLIGIGFYLFTLPFPLISARAAVLFEIMQVILIPYLIMFRTKYRKLIYVFMMSLSMIMTVKNISSYIEQGDYFREINVFTYPYVSIFYKEDIWNYREYSRYFNLLD